MYSAISLLTGVSMGVVYTGSNVIFKVKCSHNGLKQASGQCDHKTTF